MLTNIASPRGPAAVPVLPPLLVGWCPALPAGWIQRGQEVSKVTDAHALATPEARLQPPPARTAGCSRLQAAPLTFRGAHRAGCLTVQFNLWPENKENVDAWGLGEQMCVAEESA